MSLSGGDTCIDVLIYSAPQQQECLINLLIYVLTPSSSLYCSVFSQMHCNPPGFKPCLNKNCKIVLSDLCQICTNFDNFWQKDDKEAKIMRGALIFHLT